MYFNNKELKILGSYDSTSGTENDQSQKCVQLAPMASRNIVVKIEGTEERVLKEGTLLNVPWEVVHPTKKENGTVSGCNRIQLDDIKKILLLEENTLIFELQHNSRTQNDFNSNACFIFPIDLLVHSRMEGRIILQIEKSLEA
jgi:hypothetical protein